MDRGGVGEGCRCVSVVLFLGVVGGFMGDGCLNGREECEKGRRGGGGGVGGGGGWGGEGG